VGNVFLLPTIKMYFTQKFLRAKTVFHAKVARNFSVKCEMVDNGFLLPTF